MSAPDRILLVGCGKMGSALLAGWQERFADCQFHVVDPHSSLAQYSTLLQVPSSVFGGLSCVVLAVKPQIMTETVQELSPLLHKETPVLSIAAGKPIAFYEALLPPQTPVIRIMPNTPASIGCGMSVLCANRFVTSLHKKMAQALLSAVGLAEWLDNEDLMDAVTAVSGSGPAYVFHLIEALATAGEHSGLSPALSMTLARQTVIGAGALAAENPDSDAATLRKNVTSPGGTTEAALKILMANADNGSGLTGLMTRTVEAATKRGKELAG